MGIFKKPKNEAKPQAVIAKAPEEEESAEEIKHIKELSSPTTEEPKNEVAKEVEQEEVMYREVPVCMSQSQINNFVIENNIMLKQIIAEMN